MTAVPLPSIDGQRLDLRRLNVHQFRTILQDLTSQLANQPTAAECIMLTQAATFATLCEKATFDMLNGKEIDQEPYRRNVAALNNVLTRLGMAKATRDITAKDRKPADDFGSALIELNATPQ